MGQELAGLRDVDAVLASRIDIRGRAVEEVLRPRVFPLVVRPLDRLRGEGPDLAILPDRERLAGIRQEAFRIRDGAAAFGRVAHPRGGLLQDPLEHPLPTLVERPDRDAPQEPLRRDGIPARGEALGQVDVPSEREGLDARLPRFREDGIRIGQGVGHAGLAPGDFQRSPRCPGEVQRPAQVPRRLRLLRPFHQAAGERGVRAVSHDGDELLVRRVDRFLDRVRRRPRRQGAVERLAADVARGARVGHVRFAERAAGHRLQPRGCPPHRRGDDRCEPAEPV